MSAFHRPSRSWFIETRKKGPTFSKTERNQTDHRFDQATGQIYTETIVGTRIGDDSYWHYQPKFMPNISHLDRNLGRVGFYHQQNRANFSGTRSLLLTSLERIVLNISDLTPPMVELLSSQLIELLWTTLSERSLISFHIWSLFSHKLNGENNSLKDFSRYFQNIITPKSALTIYSRVLTSNTFTFITALAITAPFPLPDLIKISELVNLVSLEIINNSDPCQSFVSDFLVRAWSLSAANEKSFQILRVLRLWYHREITPKSLEYLTRFPALAIYDVRGCSFDGYRHQRNLGWSFKGTCDPLIKLDVYMNKRSNPNSCLSSLSEQKSFKKSVEPNDWDHKTHKLIEVIGLIRRDEDFHKAFTKAKIESSYSERRMGGIPLACLSLGPVPPTGHRSLIFLKIEISDPKDRIELSLDSQQKPFRRVTKRKLNDVLQEFS